MSDSKMDQYLKQGIHGVKETKPDERRRFLTSLRERVIVALTNEQVKEKALYKEVEDLMLENHEANLFLNGKLDYSFLSKYIKAAKKEGIEFTIVTNKEFDSDLGLVLASDNAIDKEDIFIVKQEEEQEEKEDKGLGSIFQNLFKK